jgi:hypothetical protein
MSQFDYRFQVHSNLNLRLPVSSLWLRRGPLSARQWHRGSVKGSAAVYLALALAVHVAHVPWVGRS